MSALKVLSYMPCALHAIIPPKSLWCCMCIHVCGCVKIRGMHPWICGRVMREASMNYMLFMKFLILCT